RRLTALGAVIATGVVAAPALAHAPVLGTFPAKGSTARNVHTVGVRFGEAVLAGKIAVKNASRTAMYAQARGIETGKKRRSAAFTNKLPAGKYTVSWRMKADDGDSETGTFSFTAK